ncbi:MAG: MoxR family ATPase [Thermodesulfobacteriota bacterium]|nr:MoxR family ATPase [Thermodesulfobacteriota bacterium]
MINKDTISSKEALLKISDNIRKVIKGQSDTIRKMLAAFLSGGHVLLEDYPGTGKTTIAKSLARSINVRFKRIQFTPDLLPSDILGVSIFNQKDQEFHFHEGPVFSNIILADEINRASPRTQSALLEAMGEYQVTVDGIKYKLPDPFFVIATQNPIEFHGTYPLPEAQMDRFALKLKPGYVNHDEEVNILFDQIKRHPLDDTVPCVTVEKILLLKENVKDIRISRELAGYIVQLVTATRTRREIKLGVSIRASLTLMRASQALALLDGYDYVTPDHIHELVVPVVAHRLGLDPHARFEGITPEYIIEDILKSLPAPV